jgi:hypothetical protein
MPKLTGLVKEPLLRKKSAIREEFAAIAVDAHADSAPLTMVTSAHRAEKGHEHRFRPSIVSLSIS